MRALNGVAALFCCGLLAGCLVSEDPMFSSATASAMPLAAGFYEACSIKGVGEAAECNRIAVAPQDDGAYRFTVDETDRLTVRFHEIDAATYAAQFADDDGDGYQYYWAARDGSGDGAGGLSLVMIWCDDLPLALKEAMKKDGLIAHEERSSSCTALKPEAVINAVVAYRDGAAVSDDALRLTPVSEP